jgi:hypothetical protein
MRSEVFDLPSGLKLEMRGIGLAEENILASADRRAGEEILDRVFAACWRATAEPGPYKMAPTAPPPWPDLLQCDRFVLMLGLRRLSYKDGNLYEVEVYHDECDHRFPWEVDLAKDLPIRLLDADAVERVRAGTPFECRIADRVVHYKLAASRDLQFVEKLQEEFPDRLMAATLRARLVDVEGVEKRDLMDWLDGANGTSTKFPGLTGDEAEELRDAYDRVDGGIDTDVEVQCRRPTCRKTFVYTIPFGRGFLMPSRGITARKRARLRGMGSSDG